MDTSESAYLTTELDLVICFFKQKCKLEDPSLFFLLPQFLKYYQNKLAVNNILKMDQSTLDARHESSSSPGVFWSPDSSNVFD
jgi:hypothetical protein